MTLRDNITVIPLDDDRHSRTCGYWYLVQQRHTAYTAFTNRSSLLAWLEDRGLSLEEDLPEHKVGGGVIRVKGSFTETMHGDPAELDCIVGKESRQLSNGSYTLSKITDTGDVHYLNPNCDRIEFDYRESRELFG